MPLTESDFNRLQPFMELITKTHELRQEISTTPRELMKEIWDNSLRASNEGLTNLNCGDCIMHLYDDIYNYVKAYGTQKD